jgi:hypothetical protein
VRGLSPRTVPARISAALALLALAVVAADARPVVFTALMSGVLVALVAFKLWSSQRVATAIEEREPVPG